MGPARRQTLRQTLRHVSRCDPGPAGHEEPGVTGAQLLPSELGTLLAPF